MAKSLFEEIVTRSITTLDLSGLKLKKIGKYAFAYGGLTSITIPDSVESLELGSFIFCQSLVNINLPKNLKTIDGASFSNCTSLTSITIPDSVTYMGDSSFGSCTGLKTVTISKNANYIGKGAFSYSLGAMPIENAYFRQPSGMDVILPKAGKNDAGTVDGVAIYDYGMFYVKTARSMNVYTDNETIKNYNWSADNITATLYHLDGTSW